MGTPNPFRFKESMYQRPVALLSFFCTFFFVSGQDPCSELNYHAFKAESLQGTYTDLGNEGVEIFTNDLDDGNSEIQEIGFAFEFHCQLFTQFTFNTNGFIKLGAESTPKANLFFSNSQSVDGGVFNNADSNNVNLIVAFNHDIEEGLGVPEFRVHTAGSAPYRVCTVQWENMREWTPDPPKQYDNMDFQVKLYESTNVIEFVYGEWEPSDSTSNYKTAACGLKGTSNADDQLLVVVKTSAAEWDNVIFHNGNYAPNESFNFGNPPDRPKPAAGQTYRFTPTYLNDLTAQEIYTLGVASPYYSSPQTISANIRNSGYNTQSDIPVILDISGANTYRDTQYVSGLAFGENIRVHFPDYSPASNGVSEIRIVLPNDDNATDNGLFTIQQTFDSGINIATGEPTELGYGFASGTQGIYFVKYPLHGTAYVSSLQVFLANNSNAVDKTVFGAVLDASGQLVTRSENYIIQQTDLGDWHNIEFPTPPLLTEGPFFAGFGMTTSPTAYAALGVQDESPLRPDTYYRSNINATGLKAMDTLSFAYRFMIGATLTGPEPDAGVASGNTTICAGASATLRIDAYSGFIKWQDSPDGVNGWMYVTEGHGGQNESYTTPELITSAYYRAEVFQPGHAAVYSNVLFVEVIPEIPVISSSGDVLISSALTGNQWYDTNGEIPGANGQYYVVTIPGRYHVIVTIDSCTSIPSNTIEILSVGTADAHRTYGITVYPNPCRDQLTIEVEGLQKNVAYRIMNSIGQVVREEVFSDKETVSMIGLSPGVYVVAMEMNGRIVYDRIIRE